MRSYCLSRSVLAIVPLALATAACTNGDLKHSAEAEKLKQTSREWARAARSGNVEAVVQYWADDAILLLSGEPPRRGRDQIRAYVQRTLSAPGFRITWEPLEAHVSRSGDIGYLVERTEVTLSDRGGGTRTERLRAVTIWRKQPDGSWKNVVDISNAGPTAATSAPKG